MEHTGPWISAHAGPSYHIWWSLRKNMFAASDRIVVAFSKLLCLGFNSVIGGPQFPMEKSCTLSDFYTCHTWWFPAIPLDKLSFFGGSWQFGLLMTRVVQLLLLSGAGNRYLLGTSCRRQAKKLSFRTAGNKSIIASDGNLFIGQRQKKNPAERNIHEKNTTETQRKKNDR